VSAAEGELTLTWAVEPEAWARAAAWDGDDELLTSAAVERADRRALRCLGKQESPMERRFADGKGALQGRPVLVTRSARRAALIVLLHLARWLDGLLERAARRPWAANGRQKVTHLLAGPGDAVPPGETIRRAFAHRFRILEAAEDGRESARSAFAFEPAERWRLLGIQEPVWA
jgi:hypothetical protein